MDKQGSPTIRNTPLLARPNEAEQLEIARLRREVITLKAERDILKKAAAYFAKESTRSSVSFQRSRSDEELGAKVHASFVASDRTYAARRVWKDMLAEGLSCGLHRIELGTQGIEPVIPRRLSIPSISCVLWRHSRIKRPTQ